MRMASDGENAYIGTFLDFSKKEYRKRVYSLNISTTLSEKNKRTKIKYKHLKEPEFILIKP